MFLMGGIRNGHDHLHAAFPSSSRDLQQVNVLKDELGYSLIFGMSAVSSAMSGSTCFHDLRRSVNTLRNHS